MVRRDDADARALGTARIIQPNPRALPAGGSVDHATFFRKSMSSWKNGGSVRSRSIERAADEPVGEYALPFLMVAGAHDKQVTPERVRDLYADLGSKQKVFIDLACSSHNAMWEKNHLLLFQASLEWLKDGKVNGTPQGAVKLGY